MQITTIANLTEASGREQDIFALVSLPSGSENSFLADFASCSLRSLQSARCQGALLRGRLQIPGTWPASARLHPPQAAAGFAPGKSLIFSKIRKVERHEEFVSLEGLCNSPFFRLSPDCFT